MLPPGAMAFPRHRPLRSFLFATCAGTLTLFFLSALFIILVGAGLLSLADIAYPPASAAVAGGTDSAAGSIELTANFSALQGDEEQDVYYAAQLWTTYSLFIDPGSQTEFEYPGTTRLKLLFIVCISLAGFLWVLMALGAVEDRMRSALENSRKRHSMLVARDHILVRGCTAPPTLPYLLTHLLTYLLTYSLTSRTRPARPALRRAHDAAPVAQQRIRQAENRQAENRERCREQGLFYGFLGSPGSASIRGGVQHLPHVLVALPCRRCL